MPAAIPGLVGYIVYEVGKDAALAMIASAIASIAVSQLSQQDGTNNINSNGHQLNFNSNEAYLPLLYGRNRVGINRVFVGTSGTNKKYLNIIGAIGEGEVDGIYEIGGVPQIFLNDELYTNFSGVYYEFFTGTPNQNICTTCQNEDGMRWEEAQRNTVYIYLRLEYNRDQFSSIPKVELVLNGLKIYNPITEITEFTSNAALCAYDYVTRPALRGGLGYSPDCVNLDVLSESIDYCTTKGWTCNMPINQNQPCTNNLQLILDNFRGEVIIDNNGKVNILFRDLNYESPIAHITEDDILGIPSMGQSSGFDRPNALKLNFLNPEKEYGVDDVFAPDLEAIANDGELIDIEIDCHGLSNPNLALEMAYYRLERARLNKTYGLVLKDKFWTLDPMDLVTITYPDYGWESKVFRLTKTSPIKEHTVAVELIEESDTLYNKTYNSLTTVDVGLNLVDPRGAVASVINVSAVEELYTYRGQSYTRLNINFEKPDDTVYPWWDYAEILVKIGDEENFHYKTKSEGDYFLDPVQEGVTYSIKIRSVSIHCQKQNLDDAYLIEHTIQGYQGYPADITDLIISTTGSTVNLSATAVSSPNLIGYEVRIGDASWESATFFDMLLHVPKKTFSGISPGTKTFWIAAKNSADKYSQNPDSYTATIPYPTNYTYKTEFVWEFDEDNEPGGSGENHTNTEHTTYDFGDGSGIVDALKCSQSGSLTGTWESPIYNLGSVKRTMLYGDFITAFVEGGKTWAGLAASMTWDQFAPGGTTWSDILNYNSQISAILKYGDSNVNEHTFENFHISSAEIDCQFFQVVVTIVDPEYSANGYLKQIGMTSLTYE